MSQWMNFMTSDQSLNLSIHDFMIFLSNSLEVTRVKVVNLSFTGDKQRTRQFTSFFSPMSHWIGDKAKIKILLLDSQFNRFYSLPNLMVTPCALKPDNAHVIIRYNTGVKQMGSPGYLEDPVVGASLNFMPWAPCLLHPAPVITHMEAWVKG